MYLIYMCFGMLGKRIMAMCKKIIGKSWHVLLIVFIFIHNIVVGIESNRVPH